MPAKARRSQWQSGFVSGAAGHWEGVAIPALGCDITLTLYSGMSVPRGGMHGYFHSIIRSAIANGVVIRTCCPVDEIIVENGIAKGVRLRETATTEENRIWADKAVISAIDVRQTFRDLVGRQHLGASFLRKVEPAMVRRLVDFSSGLTYALGGSMRKIGQGVVLVTPANVNLSRDERRRLMDLGYYQTSEEG